MWVKNLTVLYNQSQTRIYPNHPKRSEGSHHHKYGAEYNGNRRLPTEILYRTFCLLAPSGLSSICAVSRRTRAIAEPILYTSPHADSPVRVLLLARTLLGRPELARHIRSLTLSL